MNKEWFVFKSTHHLGPFSQEEMVEFYRTDEINDQTMIWKEGSEKWEPIAKVPDFYFLVSPEKIIPASAPPVASPVAPPETPAYKAVIKAPVVREQITLPQAVDEDAPPPLPPIPTLPTPPGELLVQHSAEQVKLFDDDLPPPIPLDAILDPEGQLRLRLKNAEKSNRYSRYALIFGSLVFAAVIGWYALTQKEAAIQLRIKGIMPVYLERLEMTATKNSPRFEVAMALSLDSLTLWASTNFSGEMETVIQLNSVANKVLGTEDVSLNLKGQFVNHLGKFNKMVLTRGSKFLPGEYHYHVEAKQDHFINRHFKSLGQISFFKNLNKSYVYDGTTLIYPGTPREFEKRLFEYSATLLNERLRPFQDKLERVQTFESILNATSQNYLMELEKAKSGPAIQGFEAKFVKEISPLLQSLVLKAHELAQDPKYSEQENSTTVIAAYREQVLLGKQIGEMASDMITKTEKFKKLTDKDKSELRLEFDRRSKAIKLQIDMNIKKLEEQIQKIGPAAN